MTGFFTRVWSNWGLERLAGCLRMVGMRLVACALLLAGWAAAGAAELSTLRTERQDDGIYLSATVSFELPPVVEDALLKGIPLIFVAEAEIYRSRWYWTDKRVAMASRSLRLAYQPLTRRWRLSQAEGSNAPRLALAQSYDSLAEAQGAIERISSWKIAESSDVDAGEHGLIFRFRLDLSQLPRPFQIGMAGQREWQIALERNQRLRLERRSASPQAADK
jgi:hypothetical protein